MRARIDTPSIKYVFPKEGLVAWADNVVLLSEAQNVEEAKTFMNFMGNILTPVPYPNNPNSPALSRRSAEASPSGQDRRRRRRMPVVGTCRRCPGLPFVRRAAGTFRIGYVR